MAKDKTQKKGKDKWKEKQWYTLMAPDYLGGKELILSLGSGPESMIGRKIEVPVSDFTGNFKRASAKIIFRVASCQGAKCATEFVGHSVSDDYIRRMVRRRKERIDIIKSLETSDKTLVVVKVVIVTDGKLTGTKRVEIRNTVDQFLTDKLSAMNFGDFARYIIGDDIYNDLVNATKDVYPLKKIEVRKSEVLGKHEVTLQAPAPDEAHLEQVQ
ncbi:30S ribosomal protein S3ae [Thermoplasmatales archaeon AK]|nr:30S ribosomal protein S3ae [Thermoplasmatales archaeon AK]